MSIRVGPFTDGMVSTDNIVFFLDVANTNSFVTGSGSPDSVWKDLSTNGGDADVASILHDVATGGHMNFNGADSVATFGFNAKMADIFDTGGTISFWIRPESDGEGNFGHVINKAGWLMRTDFESGGATAITFIGAQATTSGEWSVDGASSITLNVWTHVLVTWLRSPVGSEDPNFYIDGVATAETEDAAPAGANVSDDINDLLIGNNTSGNRTFDGDIDVVKMWNIVLTQAQITAEYNSLKDRFQ